MIDQIIALGGWIVSLITTIVTIVLAKNKRQDIDIVIMQGRILDLLEKNDSFIKEITELRKENAELKAKTTELQLEIETLRKKIDKQHEQRKNKSATKKA